MITIYTLEEIKQLRNISEAMKEDKPIRPILDNKDDGEYKRCNCKINNNSDQSTS
ncbi:hypothetical protein [Clostridium sp. C8-1-8]|uniref:hypothetical protein n=1 Tax=Clostridium sp. C8-1-8 TaxID=2698831 RepID=UPI001FADB35E|nr:hypothetical protein [Clostridium sp. C8-1-8]